MISLVLNQVLITVISAFLPNFLTKYDGKGIVQNREILYNVDAMIHLRFFIPLGGTLPQEEKDETISGTGFDEPNFI